MNIAAASSLVSGIENDVDAGGPGSGRHPGFGHVPTREELHPKINPKRAYPGSFLEPPQRRYLKAPEPAGRRFINHIGETAATPMEHEQAARFHKSTAKTYGEEGNSKAQSEHTRAATMHELAVSNPRYRERAHTMSSIANWARDVKAGGPGSGRHKGFGTPEDGPKPTYSARQRAFIESTLTNDENSTDEELHDHFVKQGVPPAVSREFISRRSQYMGKI